jgi:hypothetical protein
VPVPKHFRFTVRGDFLNSPEHWSFGCHFTKTVPLADDAALGDIDESGVTDAVVAFLGSTLFSNKIEVRDWRMYDIGTNGKMVGNGPLLHEFEPAELKGGSAGTKFPSQCSIAVSTIANDRGPAQRGRFYLPTVVTQIEDDWMLGDAVAGVIREAATTFLKSISDQIDMVDLNSSACCNVSPGPIGSGTGTLQQVNHLEVGRVVDTVRNRRRSMLETYNVGGSIDW